MNELAQGIYEFENVLHIDTCNFIIEKIKPYLQPGEPGISGALGTVDKRQLESYSDTDPSYNICLDIFNKVFIYMEKIVSDIYQEQHYLKQTYFSHMEKGGSNPIHIDNHYHLGEDRWAEREGFGKDKSCILYLNDGYSGGELNFIEQNLIIKPKVGSIITFEGNYTRPHQVVEVKDGERYNMITFLGPQND